MATYKFYTTAANCGIIQDQAGGVTAMPAQGMYVKSAGDIAVLYSSDPFAPSIQALYSDVLKSDNSPCASVTEAVEYIGGIIRSVATGGGGGGSATEAKQDDQINQQTSDINTPNAAWSNAAAPLTTSQWLAMMNVKPDNATWAVDTGNNDTYVLVIANKNPSGAFTVTFHTPDGGNYVPADPLLVLPVGSLLVSAATTGEQFIQVKSASGDVLAPNPDGSVNAIPLGIPYSFVKRLQVSDTQMQFDAKHLKDKLPMLFDEILNGAATSVWFVNRVNMTVTNSGDYVIRQSFRHFNYTSDRPILFTFTQQSLQPQAGSVKRVGAFTGGTVAPYNTFDGVFVESDATTTALKVYRGGAVAGSADITAWLNGASAMNLTGGTIFECEYLWLGYGGVRLSTYINGSKVVAAEIFFDQATANPFLNSPNKPIRYELRSTGGAASFSQVCAAVQTEGSSSFLGLDYSIDSGSTLPTLASTGTRYIMAALRLKSTHLDMASLIEEFGAMFTSNDDALVEVIVNPTTTTGVITFTDIDTNVNLQKFIASGAITQTITAFPSQNKIFSQYARQGTTITGRLDGKRRLGSSINGTPDTVYFCITPLSAALKAGISVKISDIN